MVLWGSQRKWSLYSTAQTTLHRMLVNILLTNLVGLLLQTDSISLGKEINLQSPGKQHT